MSDTKSKALINFKIESQCGESAFWRISWSTSSGNFHHACVLKCYRELLRYQNKELYGLLALQKLNKTQSKFQVLEHLQKKTFFQLSILLKAFDLFLFPKMPFDFKFLFHFHFIFYFILFFSFHLLNYKNSPPSIQVSREERAADMNVTFRETISVWISLTKPRLTHENEMTLLRLARGVKRRVEERRFAVIIFLLYVFAVMTTKKMKVRRKDTCVSMCLCRYLKQLIKKIKKEMLGEWICKENEMTWMEVKSTRQEMKSERRWLENSIFFNGKFS